jgi:hypothetical protein
MSKMTNMNLLSQISALKSEIDRMRISYYTELNSYKSAQQSKIQDRIQLLLKKDDMI